MGFSVSAGGDRFGECVDLSGTPVECKVSAQDTDGAMCIFEVMGGWPRHLHYEQDEWIYVIDGEVALEVGDKAFRAGAGEPVFLPRKVPHVWTPVARARNRVINVYQPAGKVEQFFREIAKCKDVPTREQVINKTYTEQQKITLHRLFDQHGMDLLRPPLLVHSDHQSCRR